MMMMIASKKSGRLVGYSSHVIDLFGKLNVVPNSNPLGIKRFVSGISI